MEKVRFLCGLVRDDGHALLTPPNTFDMDDANTYFTNVYLRRMLRNFDEYQWIAATSVKLPPKAPRRGIGYDEVEADPHQNRSNCPRCKRPAHAGPCRSKSQGSDRSSASGSNAVASPRASSASGSAATSQDSAGTELDDHVGGNVKPLRLSKPEKERFKKHDAKHHGQSICLAHQTHNDCKANECSKAHVL